MRILLILLVLATPALADELSDAAKLCEANRAVKPMEVRPNSYFKDGWEYCQTIIEACVAKQPNCVARAQQADDEEKRQRIIDLAKKLKP